MELKAIGRKGANFDSLPMRDGVDFAILFILKITRIPGVMSGFQLRPRHRWFRFPLLSPNHRFVNLLKGWLWVNGVTLFIFVARQSRLVKLF